MPIDEALIRRLLGDQKIDDFEESPVFRSQIQNRPEASRILVQLMAYESAEFSERAQEMLSLFDTSALPAIMEGFVAPGASQRANLLAVLWTILSVREQERRTALIRGIAPGLDPLFEDRSVVRQDFRFQPEIEYEYRVCDQTYAVCQRLLRRDFDESVFRRMAEGERDAEIRSLRTRLRAPAVS